MGRPEAAHAAFGHDLFEMTVFHKEIDQARQRLPRLLRRLPQSQPVLLADVNALGGHLKQPKYKLKT